MKNKVFCVALLCGFLANSFVACEKENVNNATEAQMFNMESLSLYYEIDGQPHLAKVDSQEL